MKGVFDPIYVQQKARRSGRVMKVLMLKPGKVSGKNTGITEVATLIPETLNPKP